MAQINVPSSMFVPVCKQMCTDMYGPHGAIAQACRPKNKASSETWGGQREVEWDRWNAGGGGGLGQQPGPGRGGHMFWALGQILTSILSMGGSDLAAQSCTPSRPVHCTLPGGRGIHFFFPRKYISKSKLWAGYGAGVSGRNPKLS